MLDAQDEVVQDTIVSQEAHIVSRMPDGPRGDSPLTREERDSYDNLILLCLEHHKVVDDDPDTWTVGRMHKMKDEHESAIETTLDAQGELRAKQELIYARFIAQWEKMAKLDDWEVWTSWALGGRPSGPAELLSDLDAVKDWIFTRPLPGLYPAVDSALDNFRQVAHDLSMVLHYAGDVSAAGYYDIDAFYKTDWVEQNVYQSLLDQYEWIVALIHDLVTELTRAAEHVVDRVRMFLDPLFRIEEGHAIIQRQGAGFYFNRYRPHYSHQEAFKDRPYPGLRDFLKERSERDLSFGAGVDEEAYGRVTPIKIGEEGRETWR